MRWHNAWFGEWHNNWFGLGPAGGVVGGFGDGGVATLVLDLENGYTVRHSWITDVIKFRAGNEQRISRNDTDRESFGGMAYLVGDRPRATRALLARYAAIGSVFLLALPHEAIASRFEGTTCYVPAEALLLCDWAVPGQRVVGVYLDDEGERVGVDAVVQYVTSGVVELDVSVGEHLGELMPVRHVYLEPQQDVSRFESDVEAWNINARYATPLDFAPTLASIPLGALSAPFANAIATARVFGLGGDILALELIGSAGYPDEGQLSETGVLTTFRYKPGVTTLGDFATALGGSVNFVLTGSWNDADTFSAFDDLFVNAAGAGDRGNVGIGADIDEYEDRPVWDREINVNGSVVDGVHAMTQIIDHGGIPYALGTADRADWPRAVVLADKGRDDWQWFRLFMSTVRGRQEKFWLATWREDLEYDSHSGTSLTIDADEGDFTAWWPAQRQHIQVLQADNTVTYAEVTEAVNNGDGTRTLTLSVSLSGAAVERISWLELCRFENGDSFETQHDQHGFSVALVARVVS